jgi:uncharacterized short protein YbdD (DUF466 family)
LWKLLRAMATDDAYEQYLLHHAQAHGEAKAMPRSEFYLRQQRDKWSGVSRCC